MKPVFALCLFVTILVWADARPSVIKRLLDTLNTARQRRTDLSSCQGAAQAVGQLLEHSEDVVGGLYLSVANISTNFDVFNEEEREDFFCQLSNLGTLSALLDTVNDLGILDHLIRRAYNYISVSLPMDKIYALHSLESAYDYSWRDPEDLQIRVNLTNTLESTGLLGLDPEGKDDMAEVAVESMDDLLDGYTPEPLSNEPLQTKIKKLTNAIRKAWNNNVKQMIEYNPDYSEELRHDVKEWTGIVIGSHNEMKSIVSDLLEGASNSGLQGIIDVVKEYDVPRHLLKKAYSMLVENIDWLIDDLEASINPPSYNSNYGSYGYGYEPPSYNDIDGSNGYGDYYPPFYNVSYGSYGNGDYQDYQAILIQVNGDFLELFNKLREMGLFNLEDDL